MIARTGTGWQYALADLSLILFMVTGAALAQAVGRGENILPSPHGEPLALWRSSPEASPLDEWLAVQSPDARLQLTIVAHYDGGGLADALEKARALAASADDAGAAPRIIIEPGGGGVAATLAYDVPASALAQGLPDAAHPPPRRSIP